MVIHPRVFLVRDWTTKLAFWYTFHKYIVVGKAHGFLW